MLQRINLCKFQRKLVYTLAPVVSSRDGTHKQKWEKQSKEMFTTNKKDTCCKRLACGMALEYGLKGSPYSTEWIDVHYKCTRDLVWKSMGPLHRYASLCKGARNCSFTNRS